MTGDDSRLASPKDLVGATHPGRLQNPRSICAKLSSTFSLGGRLRRGITLLVGNDKAPEPADWVPGRVPRTPAAFLSAISRRQPGSWDLGVIGCPRLVDGRSTGVKRSARRHAELKAA